MTHTPEEILDAYEIREALEATAAKLAARNMTEPEIVELRRVFEAEGAHGQSQGFHDDFHMRLVSGAHNSQLSALMNEDYYRLLLLWRHRYRWMRSRPNEASFNDHRRILEAIAQRDEECAEILMRRHIRRLRMESIEKLRQEGMAIGEVVPKI